MCLLIARVPVQFKRDGAMGLADGCVVKQRQQSNHLDCGRCVTSPRNTAYFRPSFAMRASDALLIRIAQRLSGELRPTDILARVGGDEFVLLLSPVTSMDQLAADVEHFLERLKEPFFIEGHEVFTSASIGVCLYPADRGSYDTLCSNADRAMYRIKGGAKGSIQFFSPSVDHASGERMRIEQRLRLAIRDRAPLLCLSAEGGFPVRRGGRPGGTAALARRRGPDPAAGRVRQSCGGTRVDGRDYASRAGETHEELLYLQDATRIRLAHGYYFARPMLLDEVSQRQGVLHDLRNEPDPQGWPSPDRSPPAAEGSGDARRRLTSWASHHPRG